MPFNDALYDPKDYMLSFTYLSLLKHETYYILQKEYKKASPEYCLSQARFSSVLHIRGEHSRNSTLTLTKQIFTLILTLIFNLTLTKKI